MDKLGIEVNPQVERVPILERTLVSLFKKQWADLLLICLSDESRKRNLTIFICAPSFKRMYGFQANYSKKERKFTFLQYTVRGYAKRIST